MNKQKQQLLINFHEHGVTRSHVNFFGLEQDVPTVKGAASNRMMAAFARHGLLRREASFFGQPISQFISRQGGEQAVDLAKLVNASTAHLQFHFDEEPAGA